MKPLLIQMFFLLGMTVASAQQTEEEFVFRIKVAASKVALAETDQLYSDFPDVKVIEFPDGYIRYFVGEYATLFRAKEMLPAVQAKGYKDAYVVCIHHGKILTGDEAIMKIYEGE